MLLVCLSLLLLTGCFEKCHHTGTTTVTRENEIDYTCTEAGSYEEVVVCDDCGKEISRTNKTTPAAHRPAEAVGENVRPSTCVSTGFCDMVVYCTACNAKISSTPTVIPATGIHSVSYGSCNVCGLHDSTKGLLFTLNPDGNTYSAAGMGECEEVDIIIGLYNNRTVTAIAPNSFSYDPKVESVVIDECVTTIGASAFEYCDRLTTVDIPESVTVIDFFAFRHCHALVNANVGDNVTEIGMAAFSRCTSLQEIHIGESVYTLGDDVFYECTALSAILVDSDNENYKTVDGSLYTKDGTTLVQYALGKNDTDFTVPDTVTKIAKSAFYRATHLERITVPDTVAEIGKGAFMGCESLLTITLPTTLTVIDTEMFRDCVELTAITIPETVTAIGEMAFRNCLKLKDVTIPTSVTSIGDKAFYFCNSLVRAVIPDNVTTLGSESFYSCASLSSVTLGRGLTKIGSSAFFYCEKLLEIYNLSALTLAMGEGSNGYVARYAKVINTATETPSRVSTVNDYVYYVDSTAGEYYLLSYLGTAPTTLTLPADIEGHSYVLFKNAFINNTDLRRVVIPNGAVSAIGSYAFYGCNKLSRITFGSGLNLIEKGAFSGCTALNRAVFTEKDGWWTTTDAAAISGTGITVDTLNSDTTAAVTLKETSPANYWKRTPTASE